MEDKATIQKRRAQHPACCDIYQDNDKVVLKMEMPGVDKNDLDIRIDGDHLIIDARKNIEWPRGKAHVQEIRDHDYHHEFTVDASIDRNKVDASIKNGIATLVLGVKEAEKPRKISVKAE